MEGPAWTVQRGFTILDLVGKLEAGWFAGREGYWRKPWSKGETRDLEGLWRMSFGYAVERLGSLMLLVFSFLSANITYFRIHRERIFFLILILGFFHFDSFTVFDLEARRNEFY